MNTNTSCDEIYQALENEIVSLKIAPGENLSENSLCKRFSVSRTPIRSVLQRLQQNRLVQIIPHRGTIVTSINLDITNQLIYERVAVETMVLRDFVNICTPTDMARVRYALQLMQDTAEAGYEKEDFNINEFLNTDLQMHEIWFKATGKMFLWGNLTQPHADYSRFIRLDMVGAKNVPDVLKEHQAIVEIIDTKNIDGIEPLIKHHLYGGIRRLGGLLFSDLYRDFFTQEDKSL